MKFILLILFSLIVFQRSFAKIRECKNTCENGYEKVCYVVDGDTIDVSTGERIRIIGIDTFESTNNKRAKTQANQYNLSIAEVIEKGQRAKDIVKLLLEKTCVQITKSTIGNDKDKYGRSLRYISFGQKQNLKDFGEFMIKNKYANIFIYAKHDKQKNYYLLNK